MATTAVDSRNRSTTEILRVALPFRGSPAHYAVRISSQNASGKEQSTSRSPPRRGSVGFSPNLTSRSLMAGVAAGAGHRSSDGSPVRSALCGRPHGRRRALLLGRLGAGLGVVGAETAAPAAPVVFVTALESARFLARALPRSEVVHLPEATRLDRHDCGTCLADRNVGVLELGRRYPAWHEAVTEAVRLRSPLSHQYEAEPGRLVYPDERALRQGLSQTVISVCFPSSLTHPQRSGSVETMTQRYLESMASGCLVLGHALGVGGPHGIQSSCRGRLARPGPAGAGHPGLTEQMAAGCEPSTEPNAGRGRLERTSSHRAGDDPDDRSSVTRSPRSLSGDSATLPSRRNSSPSATGRRPHAQDAEDHPHHGADDGCPALASPARRPRSASSRRREQQCAYGLGHAAGQLAGRLADGPSRRGRLQGGVPASGTAGFLPSPQRGNGRGTAARRPGVHRRRRAAGSRVAPCTDHQC